MLMKKGFLLAAIIYLFNSLGNVAQGILIKHYQQTLSVGVYEMIAIKCLVACLIMLPFAWKYLKHFHKNLKIENINCQASATTTFTCAVIPV